MAVVSRERYFDAAMDVLATGGATALTAAALCARFEVTVGSFYHHFRGVDDFVDQLLAHWEAEQTLRVLDLAAAGDGPAQQMKVLRDFCLQLPHESEAAIRAWAATNARVAAVQRRVDDARLGTVRAVLEPLVPDPDDLDHLALVAMAMLVGLQSWRSPVDRRQLERVMDDLDRLIRHHRRRASP
jgi:AcrR family transcriptional regulator